MARVCWLMGIPWDQAPTAGALMGLKTILNEFIAYVELSKLPPDALDPRSRLIMLYAMCGFANFGSLGIMIAALSTMAPERRDDVLSLGLKSIVSGTIATCLMGAIVGALTERCAGSSEDQCIRNSPLIERISAGLIRRACATVTECSGPSSVSSQKARKRLSTGNLGQRS